MSDTDQPIIVDHAAVRAHLENVFYRELGAAGVKKAESEAEMAKALASQEKFKAAIWSIEFEERKLKLEQIKDAAHRSKQANRPCMFLGAIVRAEERDSGTVFVVAWSGLTAEGDTPEIACQNFDRLWVGGEDEL